MLDNIKISEGVVIALVSIMSGLYVAFLCAFVTQLRYIIESADQNLIAALEKLRQLLSHQEIPREATEAYSELVEAYESYKCVQRATNRRLIIASTIGVVILLLASLLALGYSKLLALFLMVLLFAHILVVVIAWLVSLVKSGTSIIRFGPEGGVTEGKSRGSAKEAEV